jgi:hypothetical protein
MVMIPRGYRSRLLDRGANIGTCDKDRLRFIFHAGKGKFLHPSCYC